MDSDTACSIIQSREYFWPIVLALVAIGLSVGLPFLFRPDPDCRNRFKGPDADR